MSCSLTRADFCVPMWEEVDMGRVKRASRESSTRPAGFRCQQRLRGNRRRESVRRGRGVEGYCVHTGACSPDAWWAECAAGALWITFPLPQVYMLMS